MKDEAPGVIAGETLEQVGAAEMGGSEPKPARTEISTGRSAVFVGAGILISRIVGLIRQRIFAHYFGGHSDERDAFRARFPNPHRRASRCGRGTPLVFFYAGVRKTAGEGRGERSGPCRKCHLLDPGA